MNTPKIITPPTNIITPPSFQKINQAVAAVRAEEQAEPQKAGIDMTLTEQGMAEVREAQAALAYAAEEHRVASVKLRHAYGARQYAQAAFNGTLQEIVRENLDADQIALLDREGSEVVVSLDPQEPVVHITYVLPNE